MDVERRREWRRAYMREWRRGQLRTDWTGPTPLEQRFLAKVDRVYGDELVPGLGICWIWMGALNGSGYGVIRDGRRLVYAHRLGLELALGRPLAEGMQANHRCDNPRCVRPRHLYEGTNHENIWDMIVRQRDRSRNRFGVKESDEQEAV